MNNCNKGAKLLYSVKEHLSLKEKEYQAVTVNDLLKSVQILEDADSRTVSCNRDKTDFGTLSNKLVKLSSLHNFNKNVLKQFQSEKPPGSQNSLNKNRIDYGPSCSNIPPTEKINSGCSNEVDERDTEALEEITNFKKCKKIIHSDENEVKASDQHSYRIEEVQENKDLSSVSGSGANSLNNVSEEILKILEKGSIAEHQVLDLDKKISSNKNPMDVFEKDIKLLPQKNVRDAVQSENSEQLLGILINDKIIRNNNIYPHQTLSLKSDLTSEQEKVEDNNLEIPAWNTSSPLKMENEFYGLTYTQLFNEDFTCSMKDLGQQNSIKTNDLNKCSGPLEILNRNKEKLNLLKPPQERDHFLNSSPERENKSSANHKNEPEDCLKTLEFPLDNKSATTSTLDEASVLGSNKAVFCTAGGKKVQVDSKSLDKVTSLFNDDAEILNDFIENVKEEFSKNYFHGTHLHESKNSCTLTPRTSLKVGKQSVNHSLPFKDAVSDYQTFNDSSNTFDILISEKGNPLKYELHENKNKRSEILSHSINPNGRMSVGIKAHPEKVRFNEVVESASPKTTDQNHSPSCWKQQLESEQFPSFAAERKLNSKSLDNTKLSRNEDIKIIGDAFDKNCSLMNNVVEQKNLQFSKIPHSIVSVAREKSIAIDSDSLDKTRLVLNEDNKDSVVINNHCLKQNILKPKQLPISKTIPFAFTTAGGKSVDVDSKSLEKAKLLIDEVIVDDVSNVSEQKKIQRTKNIPFAFTTAGGRSVDVDSKSLEKAKLLIDEVIVDDVSNVSEQKQIQRTKNIPFAFTTAGGKSVDVDSKSLEKAKLLIDEVIVDDVSNVNEQKQIQRTKNIPFAFTTAGGRSVNVDSKSLEKAKLLIEEVIVDDVSNVSEKMQIQRTKSIPFAFTTAGGKSVDVDSKSLETVKLLIEEVFVDDVSNVSEQKQIQRTESIPFAFSTAGGKNVNIHSKSLDGVRVLFEDDVEDTLFVKAQQNKTQSLKSGKMQPLKESKTFRFSAASGKLVAVDSVSVGKVTLLLKDERDSTVCDSDKLMYSKTQIEMKDSNLLAGTYFTHSTSSGKIVSVDSKCLDKVRLPFKDDEGIALDNEGTVPPILKNQTQNVLYKVTGSFDFSSADDEKSGKVVRQIVDGVEFLDRADAVKECDASSSPALPSAFSTASGKSVKFDSESLCKVKSLFNEESMYGKELVLKSKAIPTRNKLETNKMVLFKTECSVEPATASKQSYFRITDEDIADLVTADVEKCSTLQNVKFSSKQSVHSCNVNEDRMSTVSGNSVNRALFQEMPASELTTENRDNRLDDNLVLLNKKYDEDVIKMVENHSTEEKKDILGIDSLNCIMLLIDEEKNERDLNEIHLNLKCLIENEKCGFNLKDSEYNPLTDKNEGKLDSFKNSTDVHAKVEYLENEAIVPSYENEEREETKNVAHKENSKSCNENINSEEVRNRKFPYANSDGENSQMSGMSLFHEVSESAAALMVDEQLNGTWRTRGIVTSPSMLVERSKPKVSIITLNENEKTGFTTITNRMANLAYTPSRRKISEKRKVYGEDEIQEFKKPKVDLFTTQIEELCKKSQQQQKELINQKFKAVIKPEPGLLFIQKQEKSRLSLRQKVRGLRPCKYTEEQFDAKEYYKEDIDFFTTGLRVGQESYLLFNCHLKAGLVEIENCLLSSPGVDPKLLPNGWVANHYRWIVWKLASMEKSFPDIFGGRCLNPDNVLQQLKYRYDREIDRAQRAAFKKISEGDESASRLFICCVAAIRKNVSEIEETTLDLELTDGWYSLWASVDQEMVGLVNKNIVCVGSKLAIMGADSLTPDQACDPLKAQCRLKISTNSCRRARWDAKMGFVNVRCFSSLKLSSILPQGGIVGKISALVARVYPILHMSKDSEGKTVFRNERTESAEEARNEKIYIEKAEELYEQVWSEVEQKYKKPVDVGQYTSKDIKSLSQPDILCNIIEQSCDSATQGLLSNEQLKLAADYRDQMLSKIRDRVLQLTNSRQTRYQEVCTFASDKFLRKITRLAELKPVGVSRPTGLLSNEVDIVGLVVYIKHPDHPKGLTVVYLTNLEGEYIAISFWTALKKSTDLIKESKLQLLTLLKKREYSSIGNSSSGVQMEHITNSVNEADVTPVQKKIRKLSNYGRPPPLSPLPLFSRSPDVFNDFRSPCSARAKDSPKLNNSPLSLSNSGKT
uniref:Tower domain-containing protein n=1 Tax=Rhodnius prolixus TaxID=13249 RepID=T1HCP8_RHOPR